MTRTEGAFVPSEQTKYATANIREAIEEITHKHHVPDYGIYGGDIEPSQTPLDIVIEETTDLPTSTGADYIGYGNEESRY